MKNGLKIKVYFWNPNGTNDIEIINRNGETVETIPEALFGLNVGRADSKVVPIGVCLKHIAVSPVSDGMDTVKVLEKYFRKAA